MRACRPSESVTPQFLNPPPLAACAETKWFRHGRTTLANNLGLLYMAQGKYVEAEPLYKRAITIDEKALVLPASSIRYASPPPLANYYKATVTCQRASDKAHSTPSCL